MTVEELRALVNPGLLLRFEEELVAANGTILVPKGELVAIRMNVMTGGGFDDEVAIWTVPDIRAKPVGGATLSEVAQRARPVTADEEREWIRRGENA